MKATELIDLIPPVEGEVRVVYKCAACDRLFARRFVPFGLGHGLGVNSCLCQLTSRNVRAIEVMRATP